MKKRESKSNKIVVSALIVLLVCGLAAVGVYAYLNGRAGKVDNTFSAEPDPTMSVVETFSPDGTVKENVKFSVTNGDGYAVYIRAAVVVTWAEFDANGNATGNVSRVVPVEGTDYTVEYNLSTDGKGWFLGSDGFYYFAAPVESGDSTAELIKKFEILATEFTDETSLIEGGAYKLSVEIVGQAVQAIGTTDTGDVPAVTDAWGMAVDTDGYLTNP